MSERTSDSDYFSLLYHYRITIKRIEDGDSLTFDWDFGDNLWKLDQRMRLYGIDTPPLKAKGGLTVRNFVAAHLQVGERYVMNTIKVPNQDTADREKFGRLLADVVTRSGKTIADLLLEKGYAVRYMGEKKRLWLPGDPLGEPAIALAGENRFNIPYYGPDDA